MFSVNKQLLLGMSFRDDMIKNFEGQGFSLLADKNLQSFNCIELHLNI